MADPTEIFDRRLVRRRRDRAASTQDRVMPILAEAAERANATTDVVLALLRRLAI